MSHFSVGVICEKPEDIDVILAKYDENLDTPRYVALTKQQAIDKQKADFAEYTATGPYARYLENPAKYELECQNPAHMNYLKIQIPERFNWTDEQWYQEAIKYSEPEEIGPDGETYSTYNPNAKWDWYQVGGRWNKEIEPIQMIDLVRGNPSLLAGPDGFRENGKVDGTKIKNIKNLSDLQFFALVTIDNTWHEKGSMGWWGMSTATEESTTQFKEFQQKALLEANPEHFLVVVDCHI